MSRYRKIEVRTWSDERFRALSAMPASGQGLWFFLLTGPHTGPIPGLFRAGRAAMAEELGWDQEGFDEAFAEVSSQGMAKADFRAKLVWLPKALRHNKPESPNVVRGWKVEIDLLPECDLKRIAIASLRTTLAEMGSAYLSAFNEISPEKVSAEIEPFDKPKANAKPSEKPSLETMANQEQEQEQEQKGEEPEGSSCPKPDKPVRTKHPYSEEFLAWWRDYPTDPNMPKLDAWKVWEKLSADDRIAARAGIPGFKIWMRKQRDYRTVHADRWLRGRRFEGFAPREGDAERTLPLEWAQTA